MLQWRLQHRIVFGAFCHISIRFPFATFFFFLNNSTPTVRIYCTVLYWTYVFWSFVTSIRFLQHGTNVFTYVCIWRLSSRFNTIPTVRTYVSYIILYGSKKIFDIWNIQESFYWYLTSSYKTAHHWFQILHTVRYRTNEWVNVVHDADNNIDTWRKVRLFNHI